MILENIKNFLSIDIVLRKIQIYQTIIISKSMIEKRHKIKTVHNSSLINIPLLAYEDTKKSNISCINIKEQLTSKDKLGSPFSKANKSGVFLSNINVMLSQRSSQEHKLEGLLTKFTKPSSNKQIPINNQKNIQDEIYSRDKRIQALQSQIQSLKSIKQYHLQKNVEKHESYEQRVFIQMKKNDVLKDSIINDLKERVKDQQIRIKNMNVEVKAAVQKLLQANNMITKLKQELITQQKKFHSLHNSYDKQIQEKQTIIKKMSAFNDELCLKLIDNNQILQLRNFQKIRSSIFTSLNKNIRNQESKMSQSQNFNEKYNQHDTKSSNHKILVLNSFISQEQKSQPKNHNFQGQNYIKDMSELPLEITLKNILKAHQFQSEQYSLQSQRDEDKYEQYQTKYNYLLSNYEIGKKRKLNR